MKKILLTGGLCLVMAPAFAQHPAPSRPKSAHKPAKTSRAASAPVRVSGRVTLPSAKPAAGAQVCLRWVTGRENIKTLKLEADAQGAFSGAIAIPPEMRSQPVQVTALLPGQGIVCRQAAALRGGLEKLNLKLTPSVPLTGRLIRPDGKPAANVLVSVAALNMNSSGQPAATDTEGGLLLMRAPDSNVEQVQTRRAMRLRPVMPEIAAQFQARTDADGRFTLTGLPVGGRVLLKPGAGLLMASGSMSAITIQAGAAQDAGLLTAVKPGRLEIHLLDKQTNKPLANGMAAVIPVNMMLSMLAFDENSDGQESVAPTNAKGNIEFKNLRPGDYRVFVEGRVITARVDEGAAPPPIQIALRQGPLRGRLLDAQGRPLAHVPITMFSGTPRRLTIENAFDFNNQEGGQGVKTRADGSFTISRPRWGSPSVWIRAAQGNDLAEWTGSPDKIGSTLTLKMRKNATVTVTGRLIDPERRPLSKQKCATLHWLDSPRSTWFATMHQIAADAQGNFRVTGLERGEAFSVVTSPGAGGQDVKSFESPRFTTVSAGQEQNLGDVMVHPVQDPGEIMTIYGDNDPGQQDRLSGLLPSPSAEDTAAARQTLARYQAALKAGDTGALQELTSRLSPGWSADRAAFLEHCPLSTLSASSPLDAEKVRALPLVSRMTGASLLRFSGAGQDENGVVEAGGAIDLNAAIRKMDLNPDFVFLAEQRLQSIRLTGVLHKEDGVWRVVVLPGDLATLSEAALNVQGDGRAAPDKAEFNRMAPPLDASANADAAQVAAKYLKFWSQDRAASMQTLTAPVSPLYSADLTVYKAGMAQREDEGICPLTDADMAVLQPVDNLTIWDQKLLTALEIGAPLNSRPRTIRSVAMQRQANDSSAQGPASFARRGDMALFRYNAAGKWYLISLVRYDGAWTVLEPAFAM